MAEEVAAYLIEAGYAEAGAWVAAYGATAAQVAFFATSVYYARTEQSRAAANARNQYNASLNDRYVMVRSTTAPRTIVLGRQRVSGPVAYIGSYGTYREHLALAVVLAAHEIDGIEVVYFDDEQVTLDGSGNVTAVNRRDLFTLTTSSATFTLSSVPNAISVAASVAYGTSVVSLGVSVSGSNVTVTGGTGGQTGTVTITYQPLQSPYVVYTTTSYQATVALDGSGNGTVTLP